MRIMINLNANYVIFYKLMSNMFNKGATGNNPFQSASNQGGSNPFNNQAANPFNKTGNNMFNNSNQSTTASNPFNNQGTAGGISNVPKPNTFGFNNNNQGGGNMFNNPNNQANNQGGGNMFNNSNNQGGGNMFNNSNQGGGNMFNNSNNQGGNMFNNSNNQGGNMFNNNQGTGTNLFNNSNNNMFNASNPQNNNMFSNNQQIGANPSFNSNQLPIVTYDGLAYHNYLESIKNQLEECNRRISTRGHQFIRLDGQNIYKDKPINRLPFKNETIKIMYNFQQLKKSINELKKLKLDMQKKSVQYSKDTHKKLQLYKRCLLQVTSQNKLVSQITGELEMMDAEIENYFKPLFNAWKSKKKTSVKSPNQFDMKVAYDVLNKFEILNQRVDDLMACESEENLDEEEFQGTLQVFEQLVQYYQNVSCSFKEFMIKYNSLKHEAIDRERKGSYQTIMSRVNEKVEESLKKQFKYYDLIKEIDTLLSKKEKREEKKRLDEKSKYTYPSSTTRRFGQFGY